MKCLLTSALKCSKEQLQLLEKLGLDIIYIEYDNKKIEFNVSEIEYVICNGIFLYNDIKKFKSLKYIQVTSAGLDRLPMDYIQENDIKVFNARGVYSIPIAEWTILKILEIYKNSKKFWKQQEEHVWEKDRNLLELNKKTACIIGYGSIGQEIAKRLYAFNVNIIAVDIRKIQDEKITEFYFINEIEKAVSNSDIIILTMPLNEQTKGIINNNILEKIKKNSILINIARGELIVEEDLIKQIENNKFLAVILDVFKEEPLKENNQLWNYKNVIITPHNSFVSEGNQERMFKVILNNIKGVL